MSERAANSHDNLDKVVPPEVRESNGSEHIEAQQEIAQILLLRALLHYWPSWSDSEDGWRWVRRGEVSLYSPGKGIGTLEKTLRLNLVLPREPGYRQNSCLVSMAPVVTNTSTFIESPNAMLQSSTRDSLQLCKQWFLRCKDSHEECVHSRPHFVPTRLVFIGGTFPRLMTRAELEEVQSYATLSHCWGHTIFLTLKKSNLQEFRQCIPSDALSKTFLDAILVCKEVGLDYIWIASLCIIQDELVSNRDLVATSW